MPSARPDQWLAWTLASVLLLHLAWLWLAGALRRARARRRGAIARTGEEQAAALLTDAGYSIQGRQVPTQWTLCCDGEQVGVDLRADYLVERAGQRFIAEVKTGLRAPRLDNRATRRQLLEYRVAYGVDGVLLVDMQRVRIHEVSFELPVARAGTHRRWQLPLLLLTFCVGLVTASALQAARLWP